MAKRDDFVAACKSPNTIEECPSEAANLNIDSAQSSVNTNCVRAIVIVIQSVIVIVIQSVLDLDSSCTLIDGNMANLKFAVRMQRLVPFLGFHHVLMMLLAVVMVLVCCSSYSTMTNVYVLGLSYTNSSLSGLSPTGRNISTVFNNSKGASNLEVRTGFFGMCVRQRGVVWLCSADSDGLREQIGSESDPLDLIGTTAHFKDDVLFSGLLFMVIVITFAAFIMLSTFPGWRAEVDEQTGSDVDVKPFPSRPVSQAALACCFVAAVLLLVSSLWQHVGAVGAAAMADAAYFGNVKTAIGSTSMLLSWISFSVVTISTIGLLLMIVSILLLDRLTDE